MQAEVIQVKGLTFIAKSGTKHWLNIDAPEDLDGSGGASRPMEMVLMALGGCTGMDVVSILAKQQVEYTKFDIDLRAENAKENPRVFTEIEIIYNIYGEDISREKVQRAIDLSMEKYCPISNMLSSTVDIKNTLNIYPSK